MFSFRSLSGILLFTILLTQVITTGCANRSRYRLDLYMQDSHGRKLADVENTQFIVKSHFVARPDDVEMLQSEDNTLIASIATNWKRGERRVEEVLAFDEIVRYRVFFKIAEPVKIATINLNGNSVAQLSGNYDIASEKKMFTPVSGTLVIDSVVDAHFFATVAGLYRNVEGATMRLDGQFKAKYR